MLSDKEYQDLKKTSSEMGAKFKKTGALDHFPHPIRDSIYWTMCVPFHHEYEGISDKIRVWFLMGYWGVSEELVMHWLDRFSKRVIPDIFNKVIFN